MIYQTHVVPIRSGDSLQLRMDNLFDELAEHDHEIVSLETIITGNHEIQRYSTGYGVADAYAGWGNSHTSAVLVVSSGAKRFQRSTPDGSASPIERSCAQCGLVANVVGGAVYVCRCGHVNGSQT